MDTVAEDSCLPLPIFAWYLIKNLEKIANNGAVLMSNNLQPYYKTVRSRPKIKRSAGKQREKRSLE